MQRSERRVCGPVILTRESVLNILFVCTGNICRSPTAERLLNAYAARSNFTSLHAVSAGTRAVIAHPMDRNAATVLEELGGDPSNFAARQLTPRIASDADLILTMTKAHRDSVLEIAPRVLRRTFLLTEAAELAAMSKAEHVADLAAARPHLGALDVSDIADPIGHDLDVFTQVANQIARLLPPVMEVFRRASAPLDE